jgi:hypothetical protein
VVEGGLGRREPTDWAHVDKYPLRALPENERPKNVPSPVGVNWYAEFDRPVKGKDGRWRVAQGGRLTRIRGGHCVCFAPMGFSDPATWWTYYDQGQEGACVGFGESRMMSLLNRKRYDARWHYHVTQYRDEWSDTPPEEGTSVRAGLDTLRLEGHRVVRGAKVSEPTLAEGIAANRWATNIDDWLVALGRPGADEAPFLNSWGRDYPHAVWMPTTVIERLMREDGEFPIITDR